MASKLEEQRLQSLQQSLWQRWQRSGFRVPHRLLVWIPDDNLDDNLDNDQPSGQLFLVLEDHQGILRLMNDQGQIYNALRKDCYVEAPATSLWTCPKADMILCEGNTSVDRFAIQDLVPLIDEPW